MTGKFPRLRSHIRRRKNGRVVTYYFYDRRQDGMPDVALGSDYDKALAKWREIHDRAPRIAGTIMEAIEKWERDVLPTKRDVTRRDYGLALTQIKPVFGPATWDAVRLPTLREYLDKRSAKTRANRELAVLQIIWNWARIRGITDLPWPAAGLEKSKWKNPEHARRVEVTDAMFDAVYKSADPVLRDAMDLATATGLRITDLLKATLPPEGRALEVISSKTGKKIAFDPSDTLDAVLARRRGIRAHHIMLLSTPDGRRVSPTMLRDKYEAAREKAAKQAPPELAKAIRGMYLRDMRKRAANLADNATELLQHASPALTERHYLTRAKRVKPAR